LRQLEKDYLLTLLLYEIYTMFNNEMIFKGGTALKYFYNLNRFSEDLDFSYTGRNTVEGRRLITDRFNIVLDRLNLQYRVTHREHRGQKQKGLVTGINFEIRVEGPLSKRLGQMQNIRLDISLRNDVLRKPDLRYFLPAYQDITTIAIPVMNMQEIAAEKVASILEREKMRDIYDLYFLLVLRGVKPVESLFMDKMDRRGEKFDRQTLRFKIDEATNSMKWKSELSYLINPLPSNRDVVESLNAVLGLK
jgi:predicted nucleotidyltransferase component of viral defense system